MRHAYRSDDAVLHCGQGPQGRAQVEEPRVYTVVRCLSMSANLPDNRCLGFLACLEGFPFRRKHLPSAQDKSLLSVKRKGSGMRRSVVRDLRRAAVISVQLPDEGTEEHCSCLI